MVAMLVYTQIIQTYADSGILHLLVFGKPPKAEGSYSSQKGTRETLVPHQAVWFCDKKCPNLERRRLLP